MSWAFSVHPPGPRPGFGVRSAACPRPKVALRADTTRSLDAKVRELEAELAAASAYAETHRGANDANPMMKRSVRWNTQGQHPDAIGSRRGRPNSAVTNRWDFNTTRPISFRPGGSALMPEEN